MNTQAEKTSRRGQVGRGRRTPGQLWQAPLFCLGLVALALVAASTPFRQDPALGQFREELAQLRAAVAPGQPAPENAVAQAEDLIARLEPFGRLAGETYFLAGSAYFRQTEHLPGPDVKISFAKAVAYFDQALTHSVAEKDMPALQYRLGLALYRLDRDVDRALELMARGVDRGADQAAQGYGVLVQAYLQQPRPDLEAALAANQKQLERIDDLRGPAMMQARLVRAEILIKRDQRGEALRELGRISADAPAEVRLPARQMQIRYAEEEGLWRRALGWWKELLDDAGAIPGGKGRILLAIGLCYANDENPDAAKAVQAWQEALALGGPEAQAAAWRLGELRLDAEPKTALDWWQRALEQVRSPNDFTNPYVELKQARAILEQACRKLLDQGDYERTHQAAELYKRVAVPGRAEEWTAQAAETQAKELHERAGSAGPDQAEALKEQSHTLYHRAGIAYELSAALKGDDVTADVYWRSAKSYLLAHDPARAVGALEKYVRLEKQEARRAEGWFYLAEAFQNQGQTEQAQRAFYKCIEYPTSPLAYRARYQLALREIDKKNFEQAKAILKQNLDATAPDMDREAHEKSLYKMASLHLATQAFDQAAWYWKEATRQYPANINVLAARDQLGNCYRKLAEQSDRKLEELERTHPDANLSDDKKTYLDEKRGHYRRTRRNWLEQAMAAYQGLKEELDETAQQKPLNPMEAGLLRKALFTLADICFELNDYLEALRRYQELQARYRGQVEGLVACYKVWSCVGAMVQTPEARRLAVDAAKKAVEAALVDLAAMPPDHPGFTGGREIWTKTLWDTELRRIQAELQRLTGAPARPNLVVFP